MGTKACRHCRTTSAANRIITTTTTTRCTMKTKAIRDTKFVSSLLPLAPLLLLLLLSVSSSSVVLCSVSLLDHQNQQHQHQHDNWDGVKLGQKHSHACLEGWRAGPVNCTGANLFGVDFGRAYLPDSRFDKAYLAHASFKDAYLSGSTFDSAVINQVDFSGIQAKGVSLRYAIVVESDMSEAVLDFADMTGASWQGCKDLGSVSAFEAEMLGGDQYNAFSFPKARMSERSTIRADTAASATAAGQSAVHPARILLSISVRETTWILFTTLALSWGLWVFVEPRNVLNSVRALRSQQSAAATNPITNQTQIESAGERERVEKAVQEETEDDAEGDGEEETSVEEDVALSEALAKKRVPFKEVVQAKVNPTPEENIKTAAKAREGKENVPPVLEKKPLFVEKVTKREKIFTLSSPLIPSPIKKKFPHKEREAPAPALLSPDSNCSESEVFLRPYLRKRTMDRLARSQLPPARMYR